MSAAVRPIGELVGEWACGASKNQTLAAALDYARRGWPVFPVTKTKLPLTEHGLLDATTDEATIQSWWRRWPQALASIATGERSGVVALDVDIGDQADGNDSLESMGITAVPTTPIAHTPRGGWHALFRHPGHFVKTIAGKLGHGLDIRGDGGSLILPPRPGGYWDPHLGLDTPLAPWPAWAMLPDPEPPRPSTERRVRLDKPLSRRAEGALDAAVRRILTAPAGGQEQALNGAAYWIGQLTGGNMIPAGPALDALLWAGRRMPSHDAHRPWRAEDLAKKIRAAFAAGIADPVRD